MRKRLLGMAVITFAGGFLLSGCQSLQTEVTDFNKPLAEFEFQDDISFIKLPVEFQGQTYQFVLDTGSSETIYDDSFKDSLGNRFLWPITVKGPQGRTSKVEYFSSRGHDVNLGPLKLNIDSLMRVHSFDFLKDKDIKGIIGMDFLKRYVVQIDYDIKKVNFFCSIKGVNPFKTKEKKYPDWGQPVPLRTKFLTSNVHFVKGNINENMQDDFLVDTGWNSPDSLKSVIFDNVYSQKLSKIRSQDVKSFSVGIPGYNSLTTVENFSVGSYEYGNIVFRKSDKYSVLGNIFLSRHIVTFDFPNDVMYLQKGRNFDRQPEVFFDFYNLGIRCSLRKDSLIVTKIDPNGLAYQKGIREKDVLIKVNELDVSSFHIEENKNLDSQLSLRERGEITFTFKRGEELIELSFNKNDRVPVENKRE
jgi:hypothetical protein